MIKASEIIKAILKEGDTKKAKIFSRFFKTGKGEYGFGDVFIGLTVPESRTLASKYFQVPLSIVQTLLKHKVHEIRFIALIILINQYEKGDFSIKEKIKDFYLKNTKYINNWDLVDVSAHKVLGSYLFLLQKDNPKKNRKIIQETLFGLAHSNNLWEQRISVIATFYFIKNGEFELILSLAKKFLDHKHDLMHKAVGWMLREVGKKDLAKLLNFLDLYKNKMPRTMLRYAIEKLPEKQRLEYLKK